jgi:hypothetical protein
MHIAGGLRNSPDNVVAWVEHQRSFVQGNLQGNIMPGTGIDARDIAAYLDTLR